MQIPQNKIFDMFADRIIARSKNTPYFHLPGYMNRYTVVPRVTWRPPKANGEEHRPLVAIHEILRSDTDRAYHDHPWPYITVVLKGGYFEHRPLFDSSGTIEYDKREWCGPGSVLYRPAKSLHWLELSKDTIATTMFIAGPKIQEWGFVEPRTHTDKWIHHEEFFKKIGREV